jgi:hypothetical protein
MNITPHPARGIALPFIPDEDECEDADIDATNEVSEKEDVLPGISQGDVLDLEAGFRGIGSPAQFG